MSRNTQFKVILVTLLFSMGVVIACLYARPQQPSAAVVKAERLLRVAGD
jgi:hypothetical protein